MTETETPVDRIPINRSVSYAVRSAPEIPATSGVGGTTLDPTQVTFTYRAAPDSQLGRVQARVTGFWVRDGKRVNPGQPMAQHYFGDLAEWPVWLAEEARLHDPDAAVSSAPAGRSTLAEDLRYVLNYRGPGHAHDRPGVWDTSGKPCEHCARLAAAQRNLAAYDADPDAVLPASVDRAAMQADALDETANLLEVQSCTCGCRRGAEFLRQRAAVIRAADETPQPEANCPSCEAGLTHTEHCPTPETHNAGCGCPSDVAAAIASCPGYEMGPSPCRCPCYGCKHHCSAHDPAAVGAQQPKEADDTAALLNGCPAAHGALGRICELPKGHAGMHTGSGPNGGAVWAGDAS